MYLDITKAFDNAPHKYWLAKLNHTCRLLDTKIDPDMLV